MNPLYKDQLLATQIAALEKSEKLWDYLAETGLTNKFDYYIEHEEVGLDLYACPCCSKFHASVYQNKLDVNYWDKCTDCPLYPDTKYGCEYPNSHYRKWSSMITASHSGAAAEEDVKKAAKDFADFIKERLAYYKGQQA